MNPDQTIEKTKKILSESFYVPMTSPVIQLKNKIVEGVYMSMTGNTKKAAWRWLMNMLLDDLIQRAEDKILFFVLTPFCFSVTMC